MQIFCQDGTKCHLMSIIITRLFKVLILNLILKIRLSAFFLKERRLQYFAGNFSLFVHKSAHLYGKSYIENRLALFRTDKGYPISREADMSIHLESIKHHCHQQTTYATETLIYFFSGHSNHIAPFQRNALIRRGACAAWQQRLTVILGSC